MLKCSPFCRGQGVIGLGVVCLIEVKTESVLTRHTPALLALINSATPQFPLVLSPKHRDLSVAQRILLQVSPSQ